MSFLSMVDEFPRKWESRGSLWRRWDLHFHTPSSFDYAGGTVTEKDLVEALVAAKVEVVAVTDHHVIDVDRIRNLRRQGKDKVVVLPGIELRCEYGGKPVHYIGLFPETSDLDRLWDVVRGTFDLTPKGIQARGGDEGIYVHLDKASELFKQHGGLISIHAGGKSNSIEEIKNQEMFQQRLKLDITRTYVDILELGKLKDVKSYLDVVFPITGLELPLIIGSDNHNVHEYPGRIPCWIKADPTFLGLRQVLNEPHDRVFLGEIPPALDWLEKNPTRVIEKVQFYRTTSTGLDEEWFNDISVDLNPGLIAVIGNKGSGKSALTDVIGLLGDSPHEASFAFLQKDQFRNPRANKAKHFDATLTWRSGRTERKNLNDQVFQGANPSVQYIPQFRLEEICDELRGGRSGQFEIELKSVIFSRIPRKHRAGQHSLQDLLELRTDEARQNILLAQNEIQSLAGKVARWEGMASETYQHNLAERLKSIDEEIAAHDETKPSPVPKPEKEAGGKKYQENQSKLAAATSKVSKLEEEILDRTEELDEVVADQQSLERIRGRIRTFKTTLKKLRDDLDRDLTRLGVQFEDIIEVKVSSVPLDNLAEKQTERKEDIEQVLSEKGEKSLRVELEKEKALQAEFRKKLDQPGRDYEAYLERLKEWNVKRESLTGDESTPNTKVHLERLIEESKTAPMHFSDTLALLHKSAEEILNRKEEILAVAKELYEPVQEFINSHEIAKDRFGLDFWVSFVPAGFSERFLNYLHRGKKGTFYGETDGAARLSELMSTFDFGKPHDVLSFLKEVEDRLLRDHRQDDHPSREISAQLKDEYSIEDLLSYLFGLEYLEPRFELRWEGRRLEQLSPGERGTLLLIFFLLIDGSRTPLIIDQPEGNLDNQTVYELLVQCIKEAKGRRQIMIVTHNPNLAVVCDAEQVIYASLDKKDKNRVRYVSGSLENPKIGNRIVDILEGTRPAIDNRVAKYQVIFDQDK